MPNTFAFGLLVHHRHILKNRSPLWPLSEGRAICDPRDFV